MPIAINRKPLTRGEAARFQIQSEQIIQRVVSPADIIKELPKLSDEERRAIIDKLRELSQLDDERWEKLLNDPTPRPKLEAFVRESAAEGESPLDPSRL
jgi:hypothetical protein